LVDPPFGELTHLLSALLREEDVDGNPSAIIEDDLGLGDVFPRQSPGLLSHIEGLTRISGRPLLESLCGHLLSAAELDLDALLFVRHGFGGTSQDEDCGNRHGCHQRADHRDLLEDFLVRAGLEMKSIRRARFFILPHCQARRQTGPAAEAWRARDPYAGLLFRCVRFVASFRPVMRYARRSSDITRCSAIGRLPRRASLATARAEAWGTT